MVVLIMAIEAYYAMPCHAMPTAAAPVDFALARLGIWAAS